MVRTCLYSLRCTHCVLHYLPVYRSSKVERHNSDPLWAQLVMHCCKNWQISLYNTLRHVLTTGEIQRYIQLSTGLKVTFYLADTQVHKVGISSVWLQSYTLGQRKQSQANQPFINYQPVEPCSFIECAKQNCFCPSRVLFEGKCTSCSLTLCDRSCKITSHNRQYKSTTCTAERLLVTLVCCHDLNYEIPLVCCLSQSVQ